MNLRKAQAYLGALGLFAFLVACSTPPGLPIPSGDAANPIVVVAPAAAQLEDELANQLGHKTGIKFRISRAASTADAVAILGAGNAQVGWLNALGYVVARKRHGAQVGLVAVNRDSDHFTLQIIANQRTGIQTPSALTGKTFCSSDAFDDETTSVTRIILQANSVNPSKDLKSVNLESSDAIAAAVYKGECDAGVVLTDARPSFQNDPERVDVLETSPAIPNHAIVFVKGFPTELRARVERALVEIARTEDGRQLLHSQGLVEGNDSKYDRLRDLLTKAGTDPANYIR